MLGWIIKVLLNIENTDDKLYEKNIFSRYSSKRVILIKFIIVKKHQKSDTYQKNPT